MIISRLDALFTSPYRLVILSLVSLGSLVNAPTGFAQQVSVDQEPPSGSLNATARGQSERQPLPLEQLPDPPSDLAALIQLGSVQFVVGGTATTQPGSATAPEAEPDPVNQSRRRLWRRRSITRFDAETSFTVRVNYNSQMRWRIRQRDDERQLRITVRFRDVTVNTSHVIWLRRLRSRTRFWDSALVQHEFDHVRISTDARFQSSLEDDLRERNVIERTIDDDFKVDQESVQTLVDELVTDRFNQMTELINIRYRELDRQTNHGTLAIPPDSDLIPILRPEPSDDPPPRHRPLIVQRTVSLGVGDPMSRVVSWFGQVRDLSVLGNGPTQETHSNKWLSINVGRHLFDLSLRQWQEDQVLQVCGFDS